MVSVFPYINSSIKFEEVDWKTTDLGRLKSSPFESDMDQYSFTYCTCYVTHHPCRIAIPCRSRMNGMLISSCQKVISVFSPVCITFPFISLSEEKGRICGNLGSFSVFPFNPQNSQLPSILCTGRRVYALEAGA